MNQDLMIVGVPANRASQAKAGIRHYTPPPGFKIFPCSECDQGAYFGPRQQEAMKELPDAPLLCFVCSARRVKKYGAATIADLGGEGGSYVTRNGRLIGGGNPNN